MKSKRLKIIFLIFGLFVQTLSVFGQSASIIIDENFSDWNTSLATFTDGEDNPGGIDLLDFQVTNDEKYLFIKFSLNTEISLANDIIAHQLWLCIDTDNDPDTGYPQQTGYGTELAINFLEHYAWFNIPEPNIQVTFGSIGLIPAPTVTASDFELALARDAIPNGIDPLFPNDTIRILIKDNLDKDKMPDEGKVFYYTFDDALVNPMVPVDLNKEASENIRIINYNIHHNDGWENESFSNLQNVITRLDGDIYGFQESQNTSETEIKNYLDTWLPTGNAEGWYAIKKGNVITCSKWPVLNSWDLWNQLAALIDLPDSYPKDILFINAHLTCCAGNSKRQSQCDEFASFVLDAKSPGDLIDLPKSTAIVYAGDMNLVGYAQQRRTIMTGDIQDEAAYGPGGPLDWDNTDLADAIPLHADQKMVYTWRNLQGEGFPPGRLDYQFFTDAVLTKEKAYVLQTEEMSPDRLALYDLNSEDTKKISDHLPVVVDYSFKVTSIYGSNKIPGLLKVNIFPNPAANHIQISTKAKLQSVVLIDLLGRKVLELPKGESQLILTDLPAGVYFLDMIVNGIRRTQKIIVLN